MKSISDLSIPAFSIASLAALDAQIRAADAGLGVMARLDAGPLLNPFVRRIHDFFQVEIGDDLGRDIMTRAGNDASHIHEHRLCIRFSL